MGPKGVIGAAFLIVGSVFFLLAGKSLVEANAGAWNGVETTGTILGHAPSGRRGGRIVVYGFEDEQGRRFEGRTKVPTGRGRRARQRRAEDVGRAVPVFYDPADPSRSTLDTFLGRWVYLLIMLFVLPHMAIGAYLIRRDRREAHEDGWARRRL